MLTSICNSGPPFEISHKYREEYIGVPHHLKNDYTWSIKPSKFYLSLLTLPSLLPHAFCGSSLVNIYIVFIEALVNSNIMIMCSMENMEA